MATTYYISNNVTTSNPGTQGATLVSYDNVLHSLLPFNPNAIGNGEFGADYFTLVPGPNVVQTNLHFSAPFTVQVLQYNNPDNVYAQLTDPITGDQLSSYDSGGPFGTPAVDITETLETVASQNINVGNTSNAVVAPDIWDFSLTAKAVTVSQGTQWESGLENYVANYNAITGYVFDLKPNTINVGNGNNVTVYGNMNELNLTGTGEGAVAIGTTHFSIFDIYYQVQNDEDDEADVTFDQFNLGHNTINVGKGSDTIDGEMQSLSLSALGGSGIGEGGVEVLLGLGLGFSPTFLMGDNSIITGNGNDTIAGDMTTLSMLVANPTGMNTGDYFASQQIVSINLGMGHNTIISGDGNDTTAGSVFQVNIASDGGIANDGSNNGSSISVSTEFNGTNFVGDGSAWDFSHNHIIDGNGSNIIYGSVQDITFTAQGGTVTGNGWMYAAGGMTVPSGDIGYNPTVDPTEYANGGIAYAISNVTGTVTLLDVKFGDNVIDVGNGANIIYGDGENFVVDVIGGKVESGVCGFTTLESTSTGPSDPSYCYVNQDGCLSYFGGEAGAEFEGNAISMGGNAINVGNGNDIVVTDFAQINLEETQGSDAGQGNAYATFGGTGPESPLFELYPTLFVNTTIDLGNIITINGSTVNLGNGNDIVVDHVLDFAGLSNYFNSAPGFTIDASNPSALANDNQLIFNGGDVINAGKGIDDFVFSLLSVGSSSNVYEGVTGQAGLTHGDSNDRLVMQGNNEINGFSVNKDVLVFNGANLADLENSMVATYNAVNHTETLTFGSMTQNNVTQLFNATGQPLVDGSGHLEYTNTPTTQTSTLTITGITSAAQAANIQVELFGSNGNSAFTDVNSLATAIAHATAITHVI